jgi:hypothetical protein
VESHVSQKTRDMGHPRSVVASADSRFLTGLSARVGMTRFLLRLAGTTKVVPFPITPLAKSPEGLWNSILSTPLRAWVGTGSCRPYGTRFHFIATYPGLTSLRQAQGRLWATICRPSGAGLAVRLKSCPSPVVALLKSSEGRDRGIPRLAKDARHGAPSVGGGIG